ncbi:MAG: META domain-containing protein [Actinomycetota bacterium]
MHKILPLLIPLFLVAAACGDDADTQTTDTTPPTVVDDTVPPADPADTQPIAADLDGEWLLTGLTDADGAATLPDGELRMTIGEDGIQGDLGCNGFFGQASIGDDGAVAMGGIGSTEMACGDQARMTFEVIYGQVLSGITAWTLDGTTLTFTGEGTTLIYERFVPVHLPLEGTVWGFDSLYEGDAVSNSADMDGVELTIAVSEASIVSAQCAGTSIAVEAVDGELQIGARGPIDSSAACEIVSTAANGIAAADRYEIDENRLTFFTGDTPTVGFSAR